MIATMDAEKIRIAPKDAVNRVMRVSCWIVCIGLALLELWAGRWYCDPDGISYLDMSDWLIRHDWHRLVNPHWGSLYPFLIGIATWWLRPSSQWELPLVHLINFVAFVGVLLAFEFLQRETATAWLSGTERQDSNARPWAADWRWTLLCYAIFAWSTFGLLRGIRIVNPDLFVEGFVFFDTALVLKLRANPRQPWMFLLLGLALGLGYLAKAILFPMAFVFLAVLFFAIDRRRRSMVSFAVALLAFVAIAAPQFIAVSRRVGRPTFSESGNLNIVWQINGQPMFPFYKINPPSGFKHPLALLHADPDLFSFGNHAENSTYPLWYDPQYWNAGASTAIAPSVEMRAIRSNLLKFVADVRMAPFWALIALASILFARLPEGRSRLHRMAHLWPLWLPAVAGLAAYSLVLVAPGYVAPFIPSVLLAVFAAVLFPESRHLPKWCTNSIAISGGLVAVFAALFTVQRVVMPLPALRQPGGLYYQVAMSLKQHGVSPGEEVGIVGSGWDAMMWARMARSRIVAQIPPQDAERFWNLSDPRIRAEIYDDFRKAGAQAVVSEDHPRVFVSGEWQKLGNTHYWVHLLNSAPGK